MGISGRSNPLLFLMDGGWRAWFLRMPPGENLPVLQAGLLTPCFFAF